MSPDLFQQQILDWFGRHGRKDLPWQQAISPYRVWISEIMLQQTQVATVIPYFNAFMEKFPDVKILAAAPLDDVLRHWSGLGYYARARNLHKAAQDIVELERFPDNMESLLKLPGIGKSTAGAILSIAFNKSHPILDGNVRRVLSRFQGIAGPSGSAAVNKRLWALSARLTPTVRVAHYTQAMMDLGATVCTRFKPVCPSCPLAASCVAHNSGNVSDYPAPKAVKPLPSKQRVFLLLSNPANQVFLEKRPPAGIWGGLWSLPEFGNIDAALSWCAAKNIFIVKQQIMPIRRHTFSHFHLDYVPLLIGTDTPINNIVTDTGQTIWYKAGQSEALGLAAPIKFLLQQLVKQEDVDDSNGKVCKIRH